MEGSAEATSHTVFVKGISYGIDKDALEEAFAAVGPVRNCFLVRDKGSNKHKGVGYVQFALREDAAQAVTQLHNSQLGGRNIKVEFAQKRPSLAERKRKAEEQGAPGPAKVPKLTEAVLATPPPTALAAGSAEPLTPAVPNPQANKRQQWDANKQQRDASKQQMVKSVAIGGIPEGQQQRVLQLAKAVGKVAHAELAPAEGVVHSAKLRDDGCTDAVILVTFDKVKHVMEAVAELHGRELPSGRHKAGSRHKLWARQVSGEGAHHKKWRVIIRNLSFKVGEDELRKVLAAAGFVWELKLARGADGKPRGFAFASYTCRAHAERAILLVNQQALEGRAVAVDWAIPKLQYQAAQGEGKATLDGIVPSAALPPADAAAQLAAGMADEAAELDRQSSDEDYEPPMEQHVELERSRQLSVVDSLLAGRGGRDGPQDGASSHLSSSEAVSMDDNAEDTAGDSAPEAHKDTAARCSSASEVPAQSAKEGNATAAKQGERRSGIDPELAELAARLAEGPQTTAQRDAMAVAQQQRQQQRTEEATVFVRGLPAAATEADLRQALSTCGPLKACRMVVDKVTGQPKGTAFAEYRHPDSAVKAAAQGQVGQGQGILVAGRKVVVNRALSKDDARALALQQHPGKADKDRRNLYLASEGEILEGSPAWEAVPPADRQRRIRAADEKQQKLRSPNFSVSRTRLAIRNIPASMTEPVLKRLAVQAVQDHASKAQPWVKQVKILVEDKATGVKSRGRGFVEFTEHEHALCALRQLNNNPKPFGSQHRPIVEFAIDDMQKLMKRNQRMQRQVQQKAVPQRNQHRQPARKPQQRVKKGKLQHSVKMTRAVK